jgi:hypothetical protein
MRKEKTHKLSQIAQGIHKGQRVTVTVQGQFQGFQQVSSEVLFQSDHVGVPPTDILEPFHTALQEIMALSQHYQTEGIPGRCI